MELHGQSPPPHARPAAVPAAPARALPDQASPQLPAAPAPRTAAALWTWTPPGSAAWHIDMSLLVLENDTRTAPSTYTQMWKAWQWARPTCVACRVAETQLQRLELHEVGA